MGRDTLYCGNMVETLARLLKNARHQHIQAIESGMLDYFVVRKRAQVIALCQALAAAVDAKL